jgi:hypothetical protein
LASDAAIVAAWRDLAKSSQTPNRSVEEISFRRDTLFAIAQRRNLTGAAQTVQAGLRRWN